jgi:hypothetical protein
VGLVQLALANRCVEMEVGQVYPVSPLRVPIVVTQAAVFGVGAGRGCGRCFVPKGDGAPKGPSGSRSIG